MTVVEAMACGLCVVSTDVGGVPYTLPTTDGMLFWCPVPTLRPWPPPS
jgi:glycosyltransferase involved in cell wall biosynthesis